MKSLVAFFFALNLFAPSVHARTAADIGARLQKEFAAIYATVKSLKPEYTVGGYLNGKKNGDHEILWRIAQRPGDEDVIRIFRDKGGYDSFEITYYRTRAIVKDRVVIRRFVGPGRSGWRNDTVDVATGDYLGMQGALRPAMDATEFRIVKLWDVQLFD